MLVYNSEKGQFAGSVETLKLLSLIKIDKNSEAQRGPEMEVELCDHMQVS